MIVIGLVLAVGALNTLLGFLVLTGMRRNVRQFNELGNALVAQGNATAKKIDRLEDEAAAINEAFLYDEFALATGSDELNPYREANA